MFNFSGIIFRLWGVCGIMFLLGAILILIEKPWKKKFSFRNNIVQILTIGFSICLGLFYVSRLIFTDVSSYTGVFVSSNRDSSVAPPLPVTFEYVFDGNSEKNKVFYLDVFSKKEIFPDEFKENVRYTIYYDTLTSVIVRVEAED